MANPTIQRRRLGIALKRAREQAGKTQEEAGQAIDAAGSKISRIELGQSGVRSMDLAALLTFYGVSGDEAISMRDMAKAGRQRGRWSSYRELLPTWFRQFVDLEGDASVIRCYQAEIIPGTLQTEAYVRAILTNTASRDEEELNQQVKIRLSRQSVLDQDNELVYVLSESALQRAVGSSITMRDQLRHLVDLSSLPNVTIQVLPFSAQTYTVASYSFVILRFDHDITSDVVYAETFTSADYLDSSAAVKSYSGLWDDLRAAALGPVESRNLITEVAEQYGERSHEYPRPLGRSLAQEHP